MADELEFSKLDHVVPTGCTLPGDGIVHTASRLINATITLRHTKATLPSAPCLSEGIDWRRRG